jgi:hypothetical protein
MSTFDGFSEAIFSSFFSTSSGGSHVTISGRLVAKASVLNAKRLDSQTVHSYWPALRLCFGPLHRLVTVPPIAWLEIPSV